MPINVHKLRATDFRATFNMNFRHARTSFSREQQQPGPLYLEARELGSHACSPSSAHPEASAALPTVYLSPAKESTNKRNTGTGALCKPILSWEHSLSFLGVTAQNTRPPNSQRLHLDTYISRKIQSALRERRFETAGLDKIFASAWLSDTVIVLGTKCNQIVVQNLETNRQFIIPKTEAQLGFIEQKPGNSIFSPQHCSGIHSVAVNPSNLFLAAGCGKNSEDIQIYSLPYFIPVTILKGHQDMVFSLKWLDDTTLVSGSRDRSVKTWKVSSPSIQSVQTFVASKVEHSEKVRDLSLDKHSKKIYSLSADGYVKVWDATLARSINDITLVHKSETVCMAFDETRRVLSVGSQNHVSIIDPRIGSIVHICESQDDGWGVRSLDIHSDLITVGGGLGRISFFDLRTLKYIQWDTASKSATEMTAKKLYLDSSQGWLNKDPVYSNHFMGSNIKNAVYTISYDPNRVKMVAAGGPLQL